jgi:hypothetical protein
VIRILENWWTAPDFSSVLKHTIGVDMFELDDGFQKYIRRRYTRSARAQFASDLGKQITPDGTFYSRPAATRRRRGQHVDHRALGAGRARHYLAGELHDGDIGTKMCWSRRALGRARIDSRVSQQARVRGDTLLFVPSTTRATVSTCGASEEQGNQVVRVRRTDHAAVTDALG